MDVCLHVFVLCCPVCRLRPCIGLTPQPRSPTKCLWIEKSISGRPRCTNKECRSQLKKKKKILVSGQ
jgi:hypothetical protein